MVNTYTEKPEFNRCRECGARIARLGDRERWHHFGGLWLGHQALPLTTTSTNTTKDSRVSGRV